MFTGFADGEAPVFTNGDTGPIESNGASDWEITSLMCVECDWTVGEHELDPEAAVAKFLKKLEKNAK